MATDSDYRREFPTESLAFHREGRLRSFWGLAILEKLQRGERGLAG
jgi:hypothetical protein